MSADYFLSAFKFAEPLTAKLSFSNIDSGIFAEVVCLVDLISGNGTGSLSSIILSFGVSDGDETSDNSLIELSEDIAFLGVELAFLRGDNFNI